MDVSVEELKSMISFGKLPEVSNGGERLIPAQAVDDFYKSGASPAKSTAPSADHYTGTEVARKLGKSVPEILQMANQGKLSVKFIDDKRLFPKQAIDQMVVGNHTSNGTKQREEESGEEYFTLEQISHALQRNVADVKREAKTETINEQIWVSKKEVERVISRREPLRQKRIRKRLPKPHLIDKPNVAAHKTGESSMKTVGKRKYYSLEEAAQFLGESVGDVWERIRKKQIPHENIKGEVYVPVLPLHDFYYDKLSPNKNPGRKPMKPATPGNIKAEEALLEQAMVPLIKNVKDLESKLRESNEENKKVAAMLEKEKVQRKKDDDFEVRLKTLQRDKESAIAELKSESEKLRQEKRSIASNLEEEKKHREDAERRVEEVRLQSEEEEHDLLSDFDKNVREFFGHSTESERIKELEDALKTLKATLRAKEAQWESELKQEREKRKEDKRDIRYERDRFEAEIENLRRDGQALASRIEQEKKSRKDAEQRARELYSELERDRTIRPETERWFNDLIATLNQSEAERKKLEATLSQEKEKARHLETDASLLAEIRNLLGASFEQPKEATEAVPSPAPPPSGEDAENKSDDDKLEPLVIKTHSGETVIFRPPFPLDSREVELIHLVAGEDEITAEQIKARINKRAADDLDDLLDELHKKELEPIIEDNDVYRFDPNFLDGND